MSGLYLISCNHFSVDPWQLGESTSHHDVPSVNGNSNQMIRQRHLTVPWLLAGFSSSIRDSGGGEIVAAGVTVKPYHFEFDTKRSAKNF